MRTVWSLPARGAWIEIRITPTLFGGTSSRSPHGERGLKYIAPRKRRKAYPGRSPHGERGLKFLPAFCYREA